MTTTTTKITGICILDHLLIGVDIEINILDAS